jgi:hypothetical protein
VLNDPLSDSSQHVTASAAIGSPNTHRENAIEMNDSGSGTSQYATPAESPTELRNSRWDVTIQTPGQDNPYWRIHNPSRCPVRLDHLQSQLYLWGAANTGASSSDDNLWVPINDSNFRDPNGGPPHPNGGHGQHDDQDPPSARDRNNDMDTSEDDKDETPQNGSSGVINSNECRDTDSGYGASEESNEEIANNTRSPESPKVDPSLYLNLSRLLLVLIPDLAAQVRCEGIHGSQITDYYESFKTIPRSSADDTKVAGRTCSHKQRTAHLHFSDSKASMLIETLLQCIQEAGMYGAQSSPAHAGLEKGSCPWTSWTSGLCCRRAVLNGSDWMCRYAGEGVFDVGRCLAMKLDWNE